MIKMKRWQLKIIKTNKPTIDKLLSTPLNSKVAYNLKKIVDEMNKVAKATYEEWVKIADEWEKKSGKKVTSYVELSDEQKKELEKLTADFDEGEIEINRDPVLLSDLAPVALSVADLSVLEPFYRDPESAEGSNVTPLNPHKRPTEVSKSPA